LAVLSLAAAALVWQDQRPDLPVIDGRVVGPSGQPVANASVRTPDGRSTRTTRAGGFHLDGAPAWVTVTADGWLSRSRVVAPGESNLVRLAPRRPGTVTFAFGGDVMFGRRFFDAREDGSMRGLLDPDDGPAAHERLLAGVAPMLADADITAVNLETPLVDDPAYDPTQPRPPSFHQTKDYAFASAPAAAVALKDLGVDVVDIGNNHLYDRLQSGVEETRRHLEAAGLAPGRGSFGAGADAAQAWAPALREAHGQRVAFLGCTSIPGDDQPINYVATREKGGAARCRPDRLRRAVEDAKRRADIVVVMVHGGFEYGRSPSAQVRSLTDAALAAGATMVINHHPHVVGGLRFSDGRLTAWSMGNLLFDQTVWPTFESYLLKVAVRRGRVVSAWVEPVRLQDYQPTGVYGPDADWAARGALARSKGPWVAEAGSLWLDARRKARTTVSRAAGALTRLRDGCAAAAGREMLGTGDFEPHDLRPDDRAPLWNVTSGDPYRHLDSDAGHDSPNGVLLHRSDAHSEDVVLNPLHRILVRRGDRLTLLVDHRRLFGAPHATVQLSWYNDTRGASQEQTIVPLPTGSGWTTSRMDVTVPRHAVAVLPFIRLQPPDDGVSQLAVDNVRLIDWDQPGCDYLRAGGRIRQATLKPEDGAEASGVPVTATALPVPAPAALPRGPRPQADD
jgi:poly-gamma-glutamate synthesis protein (capsule biosynthesis protein)